MKKVLADVKAYFDSEVGRTISADLLPSNTALARGDIGDIKKLMALMLSCAVYCDQKDELISRILAMDSDSTNILMLKISKVGGHVHCFRTH